MKKIIFIFLICLFLLPQSAYPYPSEDVHKLTGRDYFPEVKRLLSEAKKSIYVSLFIAMYSTNNQQALPNQLINELVKAKKRGIIAAILQWDCGKGQLRIGFASMEYRIPYFFDGKKIILTHGFIKKTDKVPEEETKRAERIMEDYLNR